MPWSTFAAMSVHQEAKLLMNARNARAARGGDGGEEAEPAGADAPPLPAPPPPPAHPDAWRGQSGFLRRAQSGFLLFRKDWLAQQKELGVVWKTCSAQAWAAVRSAWNELGATEVVDA